MNYLSLLIIYVISLIICSVLLSIDLLDDRYNILIFLIIILSQSIPIYIIYKKKSIAIAGKGLFSKCSSLIESNIQPYIEMCSNGKIDKKISLEIHPDKNPGCTEKATKFFQESSNFCAQNIINKNNKSNYMDNDIMNMNNFNSSNYAFNDTQYKNNSYNNSKQNYLNLSDYDLRQKVNSGDSMAIKELANRQPIRNIKLNPNEPANSDFCNIM